MDWVRAGIANRSKFLSRCNGSDLGLRSGSASVVWSFNSLGDVGAVPAILRTLTERKKEKRRSVECGFQGMARGVCIHTIQKVSDVMEDPRISWWF